MSRDETYELDEVVLAAETDKAILVRREDADPEDAEMGEDQWWIPRSLIEDTDLDRLEESGFVEIPTWFAEKEGIL